MEDWTGMGHLLQGDVREVPTIERSFLAGETERVFEITNWTTLNVTRYGFVDDSSLKGGKILRY